MPVLIEIVDWDKHYENNRTRELKRMAWVPMPNRHDGDGYTTLLEHVNGTAHFGAWCALVEVASRCDVRGTLLRDGGKAHDPESLSRMTRVPVSVWLETLPRLVSIGWIRLSEIPQEGAAIPQEGAPAPHPSAMNEWNERKKEASGTEAPQAGAEPEPTVDKSRQPPAAAAFGSAMKKSLEAAGVSLSPTDMNTCASLLIASSRIHSEADAESFTAWAVAKAKREAKQQVPGTYLVLCLQRYGEDWLAKWPGAEKAKGAQMKQCPKCGTWYQSGAKECPRCAGLEDGPSVETQEARKKFVLDTALEKRRHPDAERPLSEEELALLAEYDAAHPPADTFEDDDFPEASS